MKLKPIIRSNTNLKKVWTNWDAEHFHKVLFSNVRLLYLFPTPLYNTGLSLSRRQGAFFSLKKMGKIRELIRELVEEELENVKVNAKEWALQLHAEMLALSRNLTDQDQVF